MKKTMIAGISFLTVILIWITLIACFKQENSIKDNNKLQIVATLFPQYDFAKQIVQDKAEVKLLLNSGVETHHYEPTPKDMIAIHNSDMFLFTGTILEPWTEEIIDTIPESCEIVDLSQNIEFIKTEEFEKKFMDDTENENHTEDDDKHEEIYDEHIWLNPQNAVKMIDTLLEELCKIDKENASYYRTNAAAYKAQILELDTKLENLIQNAPKKEIAIGGEFAYAYLIERYDLQFVSVYHNCGEGEDPSIVKVKSVMDYIKKHQIKTVFYEELSEGTVAKMIAEETKTKASILYSIHNADITKDSYVSLLEKNIENLKKALYE